MINVVCCGNYWQGDDGIGIHVGEILSRAPWMEGVGLCDAGTMGLSAMHYFENCDKVVVVDAVAAFDTVGRCHKMAIEDFKTPKEAFSAHSFDMSYLFHSLPIVFRDRPQPEVVVVGIEIDRHGLGRFTNELSEPIAAAVEAAVQMVRSEVEASS